jgi:iron complex transport system substrate-binding protein
VPFIRKFYYKFDRLDLIIEFRMKRCEMKRSVYCAIILIASTILLSCTPADAHDFPIAGDANADMVVSDSELAFSILAYLDDPGSHLALYELRESAHTYMYYPRTIIDDSPDRKEITIYKPIKRVVVLSSYSAEAMRMLDATDRIVGVSDTIIDRCPLFMPELMDIPSVGKSFTPDVERILVLAPDTILAYATSLPPEKLDDKLPEGICVIRLGFEKPEFMRGDFEKLGYLLGKEDHASEIIDFYDGYTEIVSERLEGLSDEEKPRVYLEGWTNYHTCDSDTSFHEICTIAGGRNIAADIRVPASQVDPEWVIRENPDIIVKYVGTAQGSGYEEDDPESMKAIREELMNRPELAGVTAVRNGDVYCIAIQLTSKPRYMIGIAYMAKWMHPELFADIDPEAMNAEYLERFHGMPYRGVYAYPYPQES